MSVANKVNVQSSLCLRFYISLDLLFRIKVVIGYFGLRFQSYDKKWITVDKLTQNPYNLATSSDAVSWAAQSFPVPSCIPPHTFLTCGAFSFCIIKLFLNTQLHRRRRPFLYPYVRLKINTTTPSMLFHRQGCISREEALWLTPPDRQTMSCRRRPFIGDAYSCVKMGCDPRKVEVEP